MRCESDLVACGPRTESQWTRIVLGTMFSGASNLEKHCPQRKVPAKKVHSIKRANSKANGSSYKTVWEIAEQLIILLLWPDLNAAHIDEVKKLKKLDSLHHDFEMSDQKIVHCLIMQQKPPNFGWNP